MNTLLYYILVSFLPLIANLFAFIVCLWSAYELEDIKHYLDTAIRIVFIFILGAVLSSVGFIGFIILIVFILYALSTYFWKYEALNLLVFAILIVLNPNAFILILIGIYFMITTSLHYNKFFKNKAVKFSVYPVHAIYFMKKYWKYYLFILVILATILIIFVA